MLIPNLFAFELCFVLLVVNSFKGVFESTIVFLQNGVFGGQVQRVFSGKGKFEAAMSEFFNTFVSIVHSEAYSTISLEFVDFHPLLWAVITFENDFEGTRFVDSEICGFVLITEGVSADDDRFLPAWDESRDVFDDNGFSEDGSVEYVSDGSVGTLPHFLQVELLDSGLIRSDGCTLDANLAFFDGFSSLDGNFVISGIPMFHSEIKV